MKYIIMCGGTYDNFNKPKALSIINKETLVGRTVRLLKENGIQDIYISSNDPQFDEIGVPRLEHTNSYRYENGKVKGYWLDAYYPLNEPCVYLHGDVYYSEDAIKQIINCKPKVNTFIGNEVAKNKQHKNWGEPFGWIIVNQKEFREGIEETKKLQDEGKIKRGFAISWELYRLLNGLDINIQDIKEETYLTINDETDDVDSPAEVERIQNKVEQNTIK